MEVVHNLILDLRLPLVTFTRLFTASYLKFTAKQHLSASTSLHLPSILTMASSLGVPVKLLHESLGHVITVELKTGQLYRGKLAEGAQRALFNDFLNLKTSLFPGSRRFS